MQTKISEEEQAGYPESDGQANRVETGRSVIQANISEEGQAGYPTSVNK